MASKFVFAILILGSISLFAKDRPNEKHAHQFVGKGEWQTPCGTKGVYTSKLRFEGDTMTGEVTVKMGDKEKKLNYSLAAVQPKNGFFHVAQGSDKTKVIGHGYHFKHVYHYGIKLDNKMEQETFYFAKNALYVTGSKYVFSDECKKEEAQKTCECGPVAWQAKLTEVKH